MFQFQIARRTFRAGTLIALLAIGVPASHAQSVELTIQQERLLGMPNRFILGVADFTPDGPLIPERVKTVALKTMERAGLEVVADDEKPPVAKIVIHISTAKDDKGKTEYLLDLNVYNIETIATEYEMRKGTVWKIGSYREPKTSAFPREIEDRIEKLISYLAFDYFQANPYLKKPGR